jgi:hypothetical protein
MKLFIGGNSLVHFTLLHESVNAFFVGTVCTIYALN